MKNNLIYICSPYRGEVKRNKEYARELTRIAIDNGFVPVTVHLYLTEVLDDNNPEEREKGMAAGEELLARCKNILIGHRYGISSGMAGEIELSHKLGILPLYERDGKLYHAGDGAAVWKQRAQDWDTLTEAEKFKEVFRTVVRREGADQLLSWLSTAGFFEAPAGMKHHGAFPGGLVTHSNNVYRRLMMMVAQEARKNPGMVEEYTPETIAVAALLHDVCKTDVYKLEEKDGQKSYTYND